MEHVADFALPSSRDVEGLVHGRNGDPFAILGPVEEGGRVRVGVYRPDVERVEVIDAASQASLAVLEKRHPGGLFLGVLAERPGAYRLRLTRGPYTWEEEDPYRFPSAFSDVDRYLLAEGRHCLYDRLGAHVETVEGVTGVRFAVWAPNASRVSVVGPFNGWDGRRNPMRRHPGAGIWDLFVPGLVGGTLYKFELLDASGRLLPAKADPLGFAHEMPPRTASIVHGGHSFPWTDEAWMARRAAASDRSAPISIYEVHLGSWRRGADNQTLDYHRLADELVHYVKDLGFTHVELLPITEHPFSGSWGYQPIGMFAPTSRFGTPDDFAAFVSRFHEAGIGVILDWVPGHFPSDAHGLARFDGTALYEHEDPRLGFHQDWNTLIYNFGRREVSNFLEANALFWLERYHLDGLRVDAVASMLYLDYSRKAGEWVPNRNGGRENLEAIDFLRRLNTRVYGDRPGAVMIAEESTSWPQVSRPVHTGGLGFGYKWNMGWMHDTLAYMHEDPINRRYHHDKLTFGLLYAWDENFILPLSHDEVVHGKGSLLAKMPGDRWQKFANLRAYLGFMWAHPGKKLLFMGGEFAQEREWNHDVSLDWHLIADAQHRGVQSLVRDLNRTYAAVPALHELDCEAQGFEWVHASNGNDSVLVFLRHARGRTPPALVVCNFTPVVRYNYRIGVPLQGRWRELINTDSSHYGGSNVGNDGGVEASPMPADGKAYSIEVTLPPLSTCVLAPADGARP